MGLRKQLVDRLPALPKDFNYDICERSMLVLKKALTEKYGDDVEAKVRHVQRLIDRFKTGTIDADLNCMENLVAAQLVLTEVSLNGRITAEKET